MGVTERDRSLDTLLELHGETMILGEHGYWVKFVVNSIPASLEKPHGIDYSLTLHDPEGERLVGFDNAHRVEGQTDERQDHKHRFKNVQPYDYKNSETLLSDFWKTVDEVLNERMMTI
jgi:hypothetical protein